MSASHAKLNLAIRVAVTKGTWNVTERENGKQHTDYPNFFDDA